MLCPAVGRFQHNAPHIVLCVWHRHAPHYQIRCRRSSCFWYSMVCTGLSLSTKCDTITVNGLTSALARFSCKCCTAHSRTSIACVHLPHFIVSSPIQQSPLQTVSWSTRTAILDVHAHLHSGVVAADAVSTPTRQPPLLPRKPLATTRPSRPAQHLLNHRDPDTGCCKQAVRQTDGP